MEKVYVNIAVANTFPEGEIDYDNDDEQESPGRIWVGKLKEY
jgi:hypothetical protein